MKRPSCISIPTASELSALRITPPPPEMHIVPGPEPPKKENEVHTVSARDDNNESAEDPKWIPEIQAVPITPDSVSIRYDSPSSFCVSLF